MPRWTSLLAQSIRSVDDLWTVLALPTEDLAAARAAAGTFPLLVPRGFAALMRAGDLRDPLLLQVLPVGAELNVVPGFSADPLAEGACAPVPGLLRKYRGRALLVTTGACAVHCRYCFRRHFPYDELPRGRRFWANALANIADDPTCRELLLSGGDPLTLPDSVLGALLTDCGQIEHLDTVRIHSRLPVVLPERIDASFLELVRNSPRPLVMVIHANHPRELSPAVVEACGKLLAAGVLLFNQAVLLRGVNDDVETLAALCRALGKARVVPYYLHQLDAVAGAAHFAVSDARALEIHRELAAGLPGYLLPRLVRELPGGTGKTPLFASDEITL